MTKRLEKFAELVAAVLSLLARMRDLNTELMARVAGNSRHRPPGETMNRLQLELPLRFGPAANDEATSPSLVPPTPLLNTREKKKRDLKNRHSYGRPKFPTHLARVEDVRAVPPALRMCPDCGVEAQTMGYKNAHKLNVVAAHFVVQCVKRETVACQQCHDYVRTTPRRDEVLDRGILGVELLVQALVDHYDDAVSWERMERNARAQDVPLSANTLASSVGRVVDLFEPVVEHIKEACLSSAFTALDATRMPVLDAEHPLGIRNGSLWLIEGDHCYSYFVYAPTGHAKHIDELLAGRTLGSVMCDGSPTQAGREEVATRTRGAASSSRYRRRRTRDARPRALRRALSRRRRVQAPRRESRGAIRPPAARARAAGRGALAVGRRAKAGCRAEKRARQGAAPSAEVKVTPKAGVSYDPSTDTL